MNYYPFHIGDFRSGTSNMSRQARWIYRDMLDVYYDKEKPLSLNFDVLCDEIGVESDEDRKIVERLLRFKFSENENGYSHEICERVISEYHAKASIAKANGKLGGRPPKNNQNKPSGFLSGSDQVPLANPDLTGSQANQEPITNNHKPITKKKKTTPSADKYSMKQDLLSRGVSEQTATDWLKVRKVKKLADTLTAMEGVAKEIRMSGMDIEAALKYCCEKGWGGFRAQWVLNPSNGQGSLQMQALPIVKPILSVEDQVPSLRAVRGEKPSDIGSLSSLIKKRELEA